MRAHDERAPSPKSMWKPIWAPVIYTCLPVHGELTGDVDFLERLMACLYLLQLDKTEAKAVLT